MLTRAQKRFLSQFKPYESEVIEFGKRVSAIEADIIILMARKAVCFIECLMALDIARLSGYVTSDRVMDMDRNWLAGKKVAVIDDALISGTTLFQLKQDLTNAQCEVEIYVFCVNLDWWSPDLVIPVPPYLQVGNQETINLCTNIVDAISLFPRSYNVDFPLFAGMQLSQAETEFMLSMLGWESYSVANHLQLKYGITVHTIIPNKEILAALDDSLGWDFSRYSQLQKIRVSTSLSHKNERRRNVQVVPLVAFDPLSEAQVSKLWDALTKGRALQLIFEKGPPSARSLFEAAFRHPTAKLRLIQYIVSFRLADLWFKDFDKNVVCPLTIERDLNIKYLFSPDVLRIIELIASGNHAYFEFAEYIDPEIIEETPTLEAGPLQGISLAEIFANLEVPFHDLYVERELDLRKAAKQNGRKVFTDPKYINLVNRLKRGVSLPDLRARVSNLPNIYDPNIVVSLFLDIAIDRGIVVPIVVHDGKWIYRAFRYGEDIELTFTETYLIGLMLKSFQQSVGRQELPHIWLEKLLVLFVTIMLRHEKIIKYVFPSRRGGIRTGVRYARKGAVVQVENPDFYARRQDSNLTNWFVDKFYLERVQPPKRLERVTSGLYKVKRFPSAPDRSIPTKPNSETLARSIGRIFGDLLNSNKKRTLNFDDSKLTLIASCLLPNEIMGALGAEIAIIFRGWNTLGLDKSAKADSVIDVENLWLSFSDQDLVDASGSAVWKYIQFIEEEPWRILREVYIAFKQEDEERADRWLEFWPRIDQVSGHLAPALSDEANTLINALGDWSIRVDILLRAFEINLMYTLVQKKSSISQTPSFKATYSRRKKSIAEFFKNKASVSLSEVDVLHARIQELMNGVRNNSLDVESSREYFKYEIQRLMKKATVLFESAAVASQDYGNIRPILKYQHSLYVRVISRASLDGSFDWKLKIKVNDVVEAIRRRAKLDEVEIDTIKSDDGNGGLWLAAYGTESRKWLVQLFYNIYIQFFTKADVAVVFFPDLPQDEERLTRSGDMETDVLGESFWFRAGSILRNLEEKNFTTRGVLLHVYAPDDSLLYRDIEQEILRETHESFQLAIGPQVHIIEEPWRRPMSVAHYEFAPPEPKYVDVGIIAIVTEEVVAVHQMLKQFPDYIDNPDWKDGRIYYEGLLPRKDGGFHSAVCLQPLDQGNLSVIGAFNALHHRYRPKLTVLVGIAGSIHQDADLGDVVIADQIIYYERYKEVENAFEHRGQAYQIPSVIRRLINHFLVSQGVAKELQGDQELFPYKLLQGPIGSGEKVIAFDKSEKRLWLSEFNKKTLAVETEAGGLAQAHYELPGGNTAYSLGYLVVRGISDRADKEKNDAYRKIAANNAMNAVAQILQTLPDLATLF